MRRTPKLEAWRCERGHVYLHPHDACPECGARLRGSRVSPEATLLLVTTVRVTPDGSPFALGLAVTVCGRARTVCRVQGAVRGSGSDAVVLERIGPAIIARPARGSRSRA
jgi:uncharacterized OB-fold protein